MNRYLTYIFDCILLYELYNIKFNLWNKSSLGIFYITDKEGSNVTIIMSLTVIISIRYNLRLEKFTDQKQLKFKTHFLWRQIELLTRAIYSIFTEPNRIFISL